MIVTKKALPRRTFLRGAGVTLALPLLDAMAPALATATENGAILVAVTGNAGTATGDIALNFFEINAMN